MLAATRRGRSRIIPAARCFGHYGRVARKLIFFLLVTVPVGFVSGFVYSLVKETSVASAAGVGLIVAFVLAGGAVIAAREPSNPFDYVTPEQRRRWKRRT